MQGCSICASPHLVGIEATLAEGLSRRATAARFGVSRAALARHVGAGHVAPREAVDGWNLPTPVAPGDRQSLVEALREAHTLLVEAHGAVQLPKGVLATAPPDWREGVAALEAAATMPGAGAATRPELMEIAAQLRATHGMPSASTCADWRLPLEALAKLIARLENGAEDEVAQPEPAPGGLTRVIARCRLTDGRQNVALRTPLGGRSLRFIAGVATIVDSGIPAWRDADVIAALRQPAVEVTFEPSWHEWVPRWLDMAASEVGQAVRARILSPEQPAEPELKPPEAVDLAGLSPDVATLVGELRQARHALMHPDPTHFQPWREPVRRLQLAERLPACQGDSDLRQRVHELAVMAAGAHGYYLDANIKTSANLRTVLEAITALEARLTAPVAVAS